MIKLTDIIKEVKDKLKTAYIVVVTPIKKPGKPIIGKMVWGKYKDGSTLLIPYGRYMEYDAKPNLYFNMEDAEIEARSLQRLYPNVLVTIEPLVNND
jgi:hypothetical protein